MHEYVGIVESDASMYVIKLISHLRPHVLRICKLENGQLQIVINIPVDRTINLHLCKHKNDV